MQDANNYASGTWHVKEGSTDDFLARWREFLEWTRDSASGFQHAFLLQDDEDPQHFLSYSTWNDHASVQQWRTMPDFAQKYGACRALCDSAEAAFYQRVMTIS